MSMLTARELDFLASLNTRWRRLYWDELMRLLKEEDSPFPISLRRLCAAGEPTACPSDAGSRKENVSTGWNSACFSSADPLSGDGKHCDGTSDRA